jgi:hypothetical protein
MLCMAVSDLTGKNVAVLQVRSAATAHSGHGHKAPRQHQPRAQHLV